MAPIRLLLIDDDQNVHHAVEVIVRLDPEVELVDRGYYGADLLKLYESVQPDVILLDVELPDISGAQAAAQLLEKHAEAVILVISSYADHESIRRMMVAGSHGYVVKDTLAHDLLPAIHASARGQTILSDSVRETLFGEVSSDDYNLTSREMEVLRLLARGLTNQAVSSELKVSVSTVRFHTNNILEKLSVTTRSEALVVAARMGIV